MNISLKPLIAKLNETCRRALEGAAGLCLSRTHYDVEVEHLLMKLLETTDADMPRILRHYEIDPERLRHDLTRALDGLKTGNARTPALSPRLTMWLTQAWTRASINYGALTIRSGHLLLTLLADSDLARLAYESASELRRISPEDLGKRMDDLLEGSVESLPRASAGGLPVEGRLKTLTKTPALDQYTIDLTATARAGKIDPVLGRDTEIRQVIDILMRRRQNNPILTGEAGVGKTAVVEGLALRIAAGDVPPPLARVSLRTLDLALLQAGAGVKGEFESRLKSVIAEVNGSAQPIILFIDEAHTMIGAGGQAGQGDAANLLKPALARGELRTVAATTWAEYKKHIEKDPALSRRFQVVKVDEPAEEKALTMMRGLVHTLEEHHHVRILDEAVEDAVRLSHRYISGRQLPDKSVSVLDTACARVALGHVATPPPIEDCRRRLDCLRTEIGIREREMLTGGQHHERLDELAKEKENLETRLEELTRQWEQERTLIEQIRQCRERLETGGQAAGTAPDCRPSGEEQMRLQAELGRFNADLAKIQGEAPLMQPYVDAQAIAEVIASWTGIPVGRMMKDEIHTVLSLKELLERRIVGQSHALDAMSQRLRTARAKLEDPRRPIGVFLLVGPSGVGKTETALALADLLYGGDQHMTVINMSEFKEEHKVSLLMGSPPGYVGYGEGGVLTEAVRRKPYSVVLLDEMEKAHPGVQDIFYQVFDKGMLKDGEGRDIDFKNTLILMTSNAGAETIMKLCADPDTRPEPEGLVLALRQDLLKVFKPAFLGRTVIVPYYPLSDDIMHRIVELQLGRIRDRVSANHGARFSYDERVVTVIAGRCTEVDSGARNADRILTQTLLPEISRDVLARMATGESIGRIHISVDPNDDFVYQIS